MSDKFFKVFKQGGDHSNWKKQIEYAHVMDGINEEMRVEFISSLVFLETELGKGFLKVSNSSHPIKQMIESKGDWQIQELIQFVNTLRNLKSSNCNYSKLLEKLKSHRKSESEGIPFVEISECYLKEKFCVYFPDETNAKKSPDIEITNPLNGDKLFVEVSSVNNSDYRNHVSDNYHFLFNQFVFESPRYIFTGRQKAIIEADEYLKVKEIIFNTKKKISDNQQLVSYSDDRIEFTLATHNAIDKLDEICQKNDTTRNSISGLPVDFDETNRIINNKLKTEIRQLPAEQNGIVYFVVNPLFFIATNLADAITRFQEYISQFKNIFGIVLYSKLIDAQEDVQIESGGHFYSRKTALGVLRRDLLFVLNSNCDLKLTDKTVIGIYDSFK